MTATRSVVLGIVAVVLGVGLFVSRWFFLARHVSTADGLLFPGLCLVAAGIAFLVDAYRKRRRKS